MRLLWCLMLLLVLVAPCYARNVIFEDNFDTHPDWNADASLNSVAGIPCQLSNCTTQPSGWTGYRVVPSTKHVHTVPVGSIQRPIGNLADHSGTGTGKAYIVYQASDLPDEPGNWVGDAILAKLLSQQYTELYIRFWVRTQSNWQQVLTQNSAMKVFRVTKTGDLSDAYNQGKNIPSFYMDLASAGSWSPGNGEIFPAYRCYANPDDYYCHNYSCNKSTDPYCNSSVWMNGDSWGDDEILVPNGPPQMNWADTAWHRYDIHIKANTPGVQNGSIEVAHNGTVEVQHLNNAKFIETTGRTGFDTVAIGGNSHNNYTTNGDQWYAIDDFVVSTTPIDDSGLWPGDGSYTIAGGAPPVNASSSLTGKGGAASTGTAGRRAGGVVTSTGKGSGSGRLLGGASATMSQYNHRKTRVQF